MAIMAALDWAGLKLKEVIPSQGRYIDFFMMD